MSERTEAEVAQEALIVFHAWLDERWREEESYLRGLNDYSTYRAASMEWRSLLSTAQTIDEDYQRLCGPLEWEATCERFVLLVLREIGNGRKQEISA